MITMKEIARQAGASVNTVSRVLNGKLNESWPKVAQRAEMIRKIARDLGYRPNSAARTMRSQKSHQVGILVSGPAAAPYEYPVVAGINGTLQEAGYTLTVINASGASDSMELRAFKESFLEGLFIMHVTEAIRKEVEGLVPRVIWVDSWVRKAHNCIYRDEVHAGELAARRLLELGYAEVIYVGLEAWENCHPHVFDRLEGARRIVRETGVKWREVNISFETARLPAVEDRLLKMLHPGAAVLAASELPAQWCGNIAGRHGLCVGTDFGLISCAETVAYELAWPWLSRVSFDREAMGLEAGRMMLELLAGKRQTKSQIIRGCLIPGQTALAVGPASASGK